MSDLRAIGERCDAEMTMLHNAEGSIIPCGGRSVANVDSLLCGIQSPIKSYKIRSLTELWTLASVSYFLQQVAVSPPPMMEVVPALSANFSEPTLCECLAYEKGTGKRPAVKFQSGQH